MLQRAPNVTAREALEVSRLWDMAATGVAHLRTAENSNWRVEFAGRKWVLRLTRKTHRTRRQLEAELDFVEHVAAGGAQVARPLRTPSGDRVVDATECMSTRERTYATLFQRLQGRHFEYHSADIAAPLFRVWGAAMARLHELSRSFEARRGFRRPEWSEDPVAGCQVGCAVVERETLALREDLVRWLRGLKPDPLHYGMVHGDFERTNFLLDHGSIQLFDFDDCCRHWFVWEIACALWAFRNAAGEDRTRILRWFLEGYSAIRPPDTERLASFSELMRLRTIALLLRRLRDPVLFAGAADRDWIDRTGAWLRSPWSW
jgi:Ser/Thr protein kinase RdoA (MazF antagonist)